MESDKYDDPLVEANWLREQQASVEAYLSSQKVAHGGVADAPAWFVAPYLAIWTVVSLKSPPSTGWWVVSGDVPTDYLSSTEVRDAREAVRAFSERWDDLAARMDRGESHPTIQVGDPGVSSELAPLLRARAKLLARFAGDEACWDG
jgi:hypothetical protein